MDKRYKVTQIGTTTDLWGHVTVRETGSKSYRWLWTARLSAWFHKGESILGVTKYTCRIEDLHGPPQGR